MSGDADHTRRAGRGLLAIAGAKMYFIVAAYAVQLVLPRLLTPERFGLFATAMGGIAMLDNVLIAATIQSVSKFISEEEDRAGSILRQALGIQLVVGGLFAAAVFFGAPYIASFLLDDALTPLLRVAAAVVFSYAIYAALVGSLNGRHLFTKQASLDVTFSTLRAGGILGGAALLGIGALGAIGGFAVAAVSITLVALFVVGLGSRGRRLPMKTWFAFMAPIWIYQGFLNGVLQIDVQVLKRSLAEIALAGGATSVAASELASRYVGFYRGAQTFAFVPYQLILSMTFIVFPMVSKAMAAGDHEQVRATIRGAMRFSLLTLLAVAAPIAGAADGVIRVAYPEAYLAGAPALGVLVFGIAAFALFVISATVLSSAGKPGLAAIIAGVSLVIVVVANRVLVMRTNGGEAALPAAALGTSIGTFTALLLAGSAVFVRFKTFIAPSTALRGALAAAAAYAAAHFVPHASRLSAIGALAVGFFVFLAALAILREISKQDIAAARKILGR
ncbi:MAG: oligosaccharide flippase family protein [Deltaproteobacteria bacterium]|nr:oligosaccharide flippase family protein [Deltaproteobacteria bacterium]